MQVRQRRDGLDEHGSSSDVLEERVSQDQDVNETDTTCVSTKLSIAEKRRRFCKIKPSLSLAAQSIYRPLNESELEMHINHELRRLSRSVCRVCNAVCCFCSERGHVFFLNPETPSVKRDSTLLQCSSPVEVKVKMAPNKCLVEEHRDRPEEELTCGVTPEVSGPQGVKVRDFIKGVT